MEIAPEVRELDVLLKEAKLPITRVLAQAGVSYSTYWRWKHDGKEPLTSTVRKVRAAIEELARPA